MGRKCFGIKLNGGILLPPTCKINNVSMHRTSNYDYMPLIYINLQLYYLDMQHLSRMPTKLSRMLT